jgi:hypothetical protein
MAEPIDWEWYQNKAFMSRLGASFAARIGQITALQTDSPAAPNMDLGNFVSAFR